MIVAISAIAGHRNYGTYTHCWLKIDKGFIWSFMGPVALIVLINLVFYFQILWILRTKLSSLNKEVSTIKNTRIMTLKSIAQLFILGCSWGLGFYGGRSWEDSGINHCLHIHHHQYPAGVLLLWYTVSLISRCKWNSRNGFMGCGKGLKLKALRYHALRTTPKWRN